MAYCQTLKFRFHLLLRVSSFLPRPITILNIPLRSSNSAYLSQSARAPLTCRSFVFYPLNPFVKDSCFHLLLRVSSFLPRPITILNIPLRSSNSAYLSQSARAPLTCRSFVFYPLNPFVKDSCFPPDADHFRCHVSIFI